MTHFYQDLSPKMQQWWQRMMVALLAGFIVSAFAFGLWYLVSSWEMVSGRVAPRQISVSGEGKVAARPDIAHFTVGVITTAAKVGTAQQENTARSNAILDFLKKQEIAEKDLKTIGYSVSPQYQYFNQLPCAAYPCPPRRPPEIASYEVRHAIEVKTRNLEKVDELLEGVVAHGANDVDSISFGIDDEEGIRREARKKAIDDVKIKAKELAKDMGVRLGRIVGFSESGAEFPVFAQSLKGGFGGELAAAPAPAVEPGEQEIHSVVTITYEFR